MLLYHGRTTTLQVHQSLFKIRRIRHEYVLAGASTAQKALQAVPPMQELLLIFIAPLDRSLQCRQVNVPVALHREWNETLNADRTLYSISNKAVLHSTLTITTYTRLGFSPLYMY
eukprot:scpid60812/ scgid3062/ 